MFTTKTLGSKITMTLMAGAAALAVGCAAPVEEEEAAGSDVDEQALSQACAQGDDACRTESKSLWSVIKTGARTVAENGQTAFFKSRICPKGDQMTHFVDFAGEIDGVPQFTSVQDFTIKGDDIDPAAVAGAFRTNWLTWWKDGTVRGKPGKVGNDYRIEIRPLGFSIVSIDMRVPLPVRNPKHPKLESPELDTYDGEHLAWDYGLAIPMNANADGKGKAFKGMMHVLVRKTADGVHVREMWYRTQALAPLVMKWLPLGGNENRLRIAAFLHLAATQGCAYPHGTGYPGLIDAFESGKFR